MLIAAEAAHDLARADSLPRSRSSGATRAPTSPRPPSCRPVATNAIASSHSFRHEFAVLADHRLGRAVAGVQALMRVAVAVGQPALVDRFVVARHRAQHFAAARMQPQVGAERIVVADRFARDQFPGARLEAKHLVRQRADRTHVDDVAGKFAINGLADVGADLADARRGPCRRIRGCRRPRPSRARSACNGCSASSRSDQRTQSSSATTRLRSAKRDTERP